jgi:hypothetical protein
VGERSQKRDRWQARPLWGHALRVLVVVVPVLLSAVTAFSLAAVVPRPTGGPGLVGWWVLILGASMVALTVVDVISRRLLPLAALLQLTMLFPDQAPSRFRIARQAGSVGSLQRQLTLAREMDEDAPPHQAAEVILSLVTALSTHDRRTRGHSERVHVYADLLAEELGLENGDRERLRWAAMLHDIGKLDVDAYILNKPGSPDEEEWERLRHHPVAGRQLIAPLVPWLGEWATAIDQHHERYDGTGYPKGLAGEEIGWSARIVSVADAYEVMTAPRTYKRPVGAESARQELAQHAGTQFDPAVVRAFLNISIGKLRRIVWPFAMAGALPFAGRAAAAGTPLASSATAVAGAIAVAVSVGGGVPGTFSTSPVLAQTAPPAPVQEETLILSADTDRDAKAGDAIERATSAASPRASEPADGWNQPREAGSTDFVVATGPGDDPVGIAEGEPAQETSSGEPEEEGEVLSESGTIEPQQPVAPSPPPSATREESPRDTGTSSTPPRRDDAEAPSQPSQPDQPSQPSQDTPSRPAPQPSTERAEEPEPAAEGREGSNAVHPADAELTVAPGESATLDVLDYADLDPDDVRQVRVIVAPRRGVADLVSQHEITYTSDIGFRGVDRFRYQICRVGGGCGTATVTVRVQR